MITIYKYTATVRDSIIIRMPARAEVLHIAVKRQTKFGLISSQLLMWAKVNTTEPVINHHFVVRGTGHPLGNEGQYIATVVDGEFVWHVFEGLIK